MKKESGFEWSVHNKPPIKKSVRVVGRWERLIEIFESSLVIDKSGTSKWICFTFSDYREALRAASSLRSFHGNRDQNLPYAYPGYWYVICNIHDHEDHTEIWACKNVRGTRHLSAKQCLKSPLQKKLKIGVIVKNRVGQQFRLGGIWAEARLGWGENTDSNSKHTRGTTSFCVCENCISEVVK